jgi:hypothetical protein
LRLAQLCKNWLQQKMSVNLDDILDSVMPTEAPKAASALVKKPAESAEIKPWLASTANVPPEFRDKWTSLVRNDLKATAASSFQPSYAYRTWWDPSGSPASNKVLQELVRRSAARCGFDDTKTAKLLVTANPITDSETGKTLQKKYAAQLIADLKDTIQKDPNYSADKFPSLAAAMKK